VRSKEPVHLRPFNIGKSRSAKKESVRGYNSLIVRCIHDLYPYLGATNPRVIDYFLRAYNTKTEIRTVLDPFVGSGTTLVQANIMGKHAIGIDVCEFSVSICRAKTWQYDLNEAEVKVSQMIKELSDVLLRAKNEPILRSQEFSQYCKNSLNKYGKGYKDLLITILCKSLTHVFSSANSCTNENFLDIVRSNAKKAIFSLREFSKIKKERRVEVIRGDSRHVSLDKFEDFPKPNFVLTSPPYIGRINYHEIFDNFYDIFGFQRHDEEEIGSRSKGTDFLARQNYVEDMVKVFKNLRRWVDPDTPIIVIVDDEFKLFGEIARKSKMEWSRIERQKLLQDEEPPKLSPGEVALLLSYRRH
jgi:hypothetical protein